MDNDKIKLWQIITGPLAVVLVILIMSRSHEIAQPPIVNCKSDSLQNVVNQMQIDVENEEDGWDHKAKTYEEIIFEYEYGLEHLKNYHPEAYKEFHRIIGYKERYSKKTERENKQRLKLDKW